MSRTTSMSTTVLLVAIAGGLTGCGDAKAPSKGAFTTALEPVVKDRFCAHLDLSRFEIEGQDKTAVFPIVTSPTRTMFGAGADGKSVAMLDEAAALGLVHRTTFEKPARSRGSTDAYVRQSLISYAPTDKGAAYLRAIEVKATSEMITVPVFCIAKGEVVDVVRWSEPADLGGRRVSRVTYTYHGVEPIPAMPDSEQARIAEPKEATVPFELQSDGWRPMTR